jgi:hypothetical protein
MTLATPATQRSYRPPVRISFNGHGITPTREYPPRGQPRPPGWPPDRHSLGCRGMTDKPEEQQAPDPGAVGAAGQSADPADDFVTTHHVITVDGGAKGGAKGTRTPGLLHAMPDESV